MSYGCYDPTPSARQDGPVIVIFRIEATFHRLIAFGLVGIIGTGAHYLTLLGLVEGAALEPVIATTVGFIVGALVNYLLNHRFTFRSSKAHLDAGPKFFLIAVATGMINALLVYGGVNLLSVNYLLVQIGATVVVFLVNFVLNSLWTFRETHGT